MKKRQNNSTNASALRVAFSAALISMSAVLSVSTVLLASSSNSFDSAPAQAGKAPTGDANTATPIKHVIVIVGENRSFDHLFATYEPKPGESVNNLLSEGIVNADGTPGPNYSRRPILADITGSPTFQLSPTTEKLPTLCRRR